MIGQCKFCGQNKDLRFGGCFDCAEAEAIIDEGLDMKDVGVGGEKDKAATYPGEKLKMLIERGWTLLSNIEKQKLDR
jgi:hypothetical protein